MTVDEMLSIYSSEQSVTSSDPTETMVAGLEALLVQVTTNAPAIGLTPGTTYHVYFVTVNNAPMTITLEAADEEFDEFLEKALAMLDSIGWKQANE